MKESVVAKSNGAVAANTVTTYDTPSMDELIVKLTRAQSLKSMADSVADYFSKTRSGSSGFIFVEAPERLQLVSQWRSPRLGEKHLADLMIDNNPADRAFRTGVPVLSPRHACGGQRSRSLRRPIHRRHYHSVSCFPISAPDQKPVGVLAVILPDGEHVGAEFRKDLFRLRQIMGGCIVRTRAYDSAIAAYAGMENTCRRKDEFISVLSHELRNSMMPILGWATMLNKATLPADKQHQALTGIIRNVRSLNYLIEDLFDSVRILTGKLRLQRAKIRIQDVARDALSAIEHVAEKKRLRVSTDISESIPPFLADSGRLRQVLINLLNNAVKFTPKGGTINLKVRRRRDKVECIVSDSGSGIEGKFLPFVFDRYRQDGPAKMPAGGLGLGLGIARQIAALHHGTIRAFSEGPNKGSTFTLRLPMRAKFG